MLLTDSLVRISFDGQSTVDYSIRALSKLRRTATNRDQLLLRSIGSDIDRLREYVSALKAELQPRLERLSASQPIHSSLSHSSSLPPFTPQTSSQMHKAASTLQAAWRRRSHLSHRRSAFRELDYCPAALSRAFLRGERMPYVRHRSEDVVVDLVPQEAAAAPDATPASLDIRAARRSAGGAAPPGGAHFMSIL